MASTGRRSAWLGPMPGFWFSGPQSPIQSDVAASFGRSFTASLVTTLPKLALSGWGFRGEERPLWRLQICQALRSPQYRQFCAQCVPGTAHAIMLGSLTGAAAEVQVYIYFAMMCVITAVPAAMLWHAVCVRTISPRGELHRLWLASRAFFFGVGLSIFFKLMMWLLAVSPVETKDCDLSLPSGLVRPTPRCIVLYFARFVALHRV